MYQHHDETARSAWWRVGDIDRQLSNLFHIPNEEGCVMACLNLFSDRMDVSELIVYLFMITENTYGRIFLCFLRNMHC